MTITSGDMALYSVALLILFLTPGPVWLALMARTLAGGFAGAWPLAVGVAIGDAVWPFLAIVGAGFVASELDGALGVMRWLAALVFVWMGLAAIRSAGDRIDADNRLTRPGRAAGFFAGVAAILGNPKAILFYMGVLPGFFDLSRVTRPDIAAIVGLSIVVPLFGNLVFAWGIGRLRHLLMTPRGLRRTNLLAGSLLIGVGVILPFT